MDTNTPGRPRYLRTDNPTPMILMQRDLEALRLLNRYRYLRSPYLRAFLPGSKYKITKRLGQLFQHGYVDRPRAETRIGFMRSLPELYEIADKGIEALKLAGLFDPIDRVTIRAGKTRVKEFYHETYVCDLLASLELGVRETGLRYLSLYDILRGAPQSTQDDDFPLTVWIDRANNRKLTPDGLFGIQLENGKRAFFFLEADRDTETIGVYRKKMQAYLDHYKLIYRHFGIDNFRVLTVTVNSTHMENILKQSPNPRMFLFKTLTSFGEFTRPPEPSPHIFTKAWRRRDLPPETVHGLAGETERAGRPQAAA